MGCCSGGAIAARGRRLDSLCKLGRAYRFCSSVHRLQLQLSKEAMALTRLLLFTATAGSAAALAPNTRRFTRAARATARRRGAAASRAACSTTRTTSRPSISKLGPRRRPRSPRRRRRVDR